MSLNPYLTFLACGCPLGVRRQDELACGPFVEVTSAYNSLNTQVRSISIVGYVSEYLHRSSAVGGPLDRSIPSLLSIFLSCCRLVVECLTPCRTAGWSIPAK